MNPIAALTQPMMAQPMMGQPAQSSGLNTESLYSGAATLGKVNSYIYLFFGNLIGWPLLIASIYLLATKATPEPTQSEEEAKGMRRKTGLIMMGISVLILLFVWGYWWLVKTYKPFAAYAGVDLLTPGPGLSF